MKKCKKCNNSFKKNTKWQLYCSKKCKDQYKSEKKYKVWLEESINRDREIIYHGYKDPLIPIKKPYYGFEGVVLEDADTGEIQCSICGGWFGHTGLHISQKHRGDIKNYKNIKDYKDKFGLLRSTPLCSKQVRANMIKASARYWENVTPADMKKIKKRYANNMLKLNRKKRGYSSGQEKMERKNHLGLCYMQLLDTIKKIAIKLGRTPRHSELISYRGTLIRNTIVATFGSVKEAYRIVGLESNTRNQLAELSDKFLLECLKAFRKEYERDGSGSDCRSYLLPNEHIYKTRFGSIKEANKLI